jgi:hypothetical protein
MSKLSEDIRELITQVFPYYKLRSEFFVSYNNMKLFFDFYIPELKIAFEAQGIQHFKYVEYFHKNSFNFKSSKKRDAAKKEWAYENGVVLIEIDDSDMPMGANEFLNLIHRECHKQL